MPLDIQAYDYLLAILVLIIIKIQNLTFSVEKTENRVARFIILLEEMLRDCPTNQESLLSTNGFAVIGALLINVR